MNKIIQYFFRSSLSLIALIAFSLPSFDELAAIYIQTALLSAHLLILPANPSFFQSSHHLRCLSLYQQPTVHHESKLPISHIATTAANKSRLLTPNPQPSPT